MGLLDALSFYYMRRFAPTHIALIDGSSAYQYHATSFLTLIRSV